jgi:hypothetical protein
MGRGGAHAGPLITRLTGIAASADSASRLRAWLTVTTSIHSVNDARPFTPL